MSWEIISSELLNLNLSECNIEHVLWNNWIFKDEKSPLKNYPRATLNNVGQGRFLKPKSKTIESFLSILLSIFGGTMKNNLPQSKMISLSLLALQYVEHVYCLVKGWSIALSLSIILSNEQVSPDYGLLSLHHVEEGCRMVFIHILTFELYICTDVYWIDWA